MIDKEISRIIEEQYARAIDILSLNREKLTDLANRLLEKEVIFKDDLEKIFGKRPFGKEEQDEEPFTDASEASSSEEIDHSSPEDTPTE